MNPWTTHQREYQDLRSTLEEKGRESGFMLNPDTDRLQKVLGLMTENLVATGKPFCPCKQSHPLDAGKDAVCPCPEWKSEVAAEGHCFCRLFFSGDDL